jgi:hypothetical protein
MRINFLPGKRVNPRKIPSGIPKIVLIKMAVKETRKVKREISKIPGSPDVIN